MPFSEWFAGVVFAYDACFFYNVADIYGEIIVGRSLAALCGGYGG